MNPRVVLFFVGIVIFIMGFVPLIANSVPAAAGWIEGLPPAGSMIYQAVLSVLGVVALSYAIRGEGKKPNMDILKALSKN